FFTTIILGIKIIKNRKEIRIVSNLGGHIYLGFITYIISRLTGRKHLLRINDDTVLSTTLFLKKIGILNYYIFIKIISTLLRVIERFLFKHTDWIITHGPMDYERVKILTKKCSLIPLSIDISKFKPFLRSKSIVLKEEIAGRNKVILFIGRLTKIKGLDYLFYSFKKVLNKIPNCILLIIGIGPEELNYHKLMKKLNIEKNVNFLGYINHDKLPEYYNIADVYVLSSLREELSNTLMEAMACGIPVVATDVGGNSYLIEDGVNGFLVPINDVNLLTKKIIYIIENKVNVSSITKKGVLKIRKIAEIDVSLKYEKVLFNLLSSSNYIHDEIIKNK
ncbi:glycosyltransferase, partial [Thaumarchaeota archaeon SCGC AB-539-E09]